MRHLFLMVGFLWATAFPSRADIKDHPDYKSWIRALQDGSDLEQAQAAMKLSAHGPKALPALSALRLAFQKTESSNVAEAIAQTFAVIGPDAKDAIPDILAKLKTADQNTSLLSDLASALVALGEPGHPEVVRACMLLPEGGGKKKASNPMRHFLTKHPKALLPNLIQALENEDSETNGRLLRWLLIALTDTRQPPPVFDTPALEQSRQQLVAKLDDLLERSKLTGDYVSQTLLLIDPNSFPKALPVYLQTIQRSAYRVNSRLLIEGQRNDCAQLIIPYLDHPNPQVVNTARSLLADCDSGLTHIRAGLHHRNPSIRGEILLLLQGLSKWAMAFHSEIMNALHDPEPKVRLAAAAVLITHQRKQSTPAIPMLLALANDTTSPHRVEAIRWLSQQASVARAATPTLLRLCRSPNRTVRFAAGEALAHIDRKTAPSYVPVLAEMAGGDVPSQTAIHLLELTGPAARLAAPALKKHLTNTNFRLRLAAAIALTSVAPTEMTEALDVLAEFAKRPNGLGMRALSTLRRLGSAAKPCLPALNELLRANMKADPEFDEYELALLAITIIHIDPANANNAYAVFRTQLARGQSDGLERLADLGELVKPLLPDLSTALSSKHQHVRDAVLEVLTQLGPSAKDALPVLRELPQSDPNRKAAIQAAIKKIEGK
jgi:HEAT repeat protein